MDERHELLKKISGVSFAVNDLTLYLDTHPADTKALSLFCGYLEERKQLLASYEEKYEPLTINCIEKNGIKNHQCDSPYAGREHFTWTDGPMPWEGGHI